MASKKPLYKALRDMSNNAAKYTDNILSTYSTRITVT